MGMGWAILTVASDPWPHQHEAGGGLSLGLGARCALRRRRRRRRGVADRQPRSRGSTGGRVENFESPHLFGQRAVTVRLLGGIVRGEPLFAALQTAPRCSHGLHTAPSYGSPLDVACAYHWAPNPAWDLHAPLLGDDAAKLRATGSLSRPLHALEVGPGGSIMETLRRGPPVLGRDACWPAAGAV